MEKPIKSQGQLKGLIPNNLILAIVDFIEGNLVQFCDEFSNKNIENERGLTQGLCDILNAKAIEKSIMQLRGE